MKSLNFNVFSLAKSVVPLTGFFSRSLLNTFTPKQSTNFTLLNADSGAYDILFPGKEKHLHLHHTGTRGTKICARKNRAFLSVFRYDFVTESVTLLLRCETLLETLLKRQGVSHGAY
jgi:hypothetical protein